jgi:cytochrome b6-f complex iron-sulfur subunit
LGCQVEWKRDQEEFVCPCHKGTYAIDGTVLSGPPPAPLHELALRYFRMVHL